MPIITSRYFLNSVSKSEEDPDYEYSTSWTSRPDYSNNGITSRNPEKEPLESLQEAVKERDLDRKVIKAFDGKRPIGTLRFAARKENIAVEQYISNL